MAMYAINKQGLRERPSYDELIGYLEYGQEKITYPDRFFKQLRETPQLSNLLDGEGFSVNDMNEQQMKQAKEIAKELAIIQAGGTAQVSRTASHEPSNVSAVADDLNGQDLNDDIKGSLQSMYERAIQKANETAQKNKEELNIVDEAQRRALLGVAPPPSKSGSSGDPIPKGIGKPPPSLLEPKPTEEQIRTAQQIPPRLAPETKAKAKAKSLGLLRRNVPTAKEVQMAQDMAVPRGAISTTSTSSGSNGNGASSSSNTSKQQAKAKSVYPTLDPPTALLMYPAEPKAKGKGRPKGKAKPK